MTDGDGHREAGGGDRLASVLRPVRAGNGFEEALERVLQVVRLGLVPAGERLPPERDLAVRLRISRVTLREVLRVLQEQGLVESRRGRHGGTFVLPGPARDPNGDPHEELRGLARTRGAGAIEDTLRFREVLETGAAELCAAGRLDGPARRRLLSCLDATREASPADYRRMDTLLHLTLAELSGSPSLAAHYAAARAEVNELLDRLPLLVRNLEHSQAQHAALVAAVLAGDMDGARRAAREHAGGTASLVRGFLG